MSKQELMGFWVQVITGVAVVVGLGMVVYELKQTQDLARLQLASDGWLDAIETERTVLGESFAETYAKACLGEDLTKVEVTQMGSYHVILMQQVNRAINYSNVGHETESWRSLAERNVSRWLSTKVGRADYATAKKLGFLRPYQIEIGNKLIDEQRLTRCEDYYGGILQILESDVDPYKTN